MLFRSFQSASVFSNPAPANPVFTYLDFSYIGKTRDFTGTEWMASMNLGIGGAWQTNGTSISVNFWFYPTANGVQLLSECNNQGVDEGYHYTVLEMTSSNYIKARYYNGTPVTSTNTADLNQWNHVYWAEDTQGGHTFELNGVPTTGNPTYTRTAPSSDSEYFGIGFYDGTNMGNTGRFTGKVGWLTVSDYVAGSTYSSTAAKFGR